MKPEKIIDATGLKCPLPVLKAQRALRDMRSGMVLLVHATDTNASGDFRDLCNITNDELLNSTLENGVFSFYIKKS